MKSKNIVIAVLVVIVLIVGGVIYFTKPVSNPTGEQPAGIATGPNHYQNESFLQGLSGGTRNQFSVSNDGSLTVTGNTVTYVQPYSGLSYTETVAYYNRAGINYADVEKSFTGTATTTPCSLFNPFGMATTTQSANATTSVFFAGFQITTPTTTTATLSADIGTSTTAYATSTILYLRNTLISSGFTANRHWIAPGVAGTTTSSVLVGTNAGTGEQDNNMLRAGDWLNLKFSSAAGAFGPNYGGICFATYAKP